MKKGMRLLCRDFTLLASNKYDELAESSSTDESVDLDFEAAKEDLMLAVDEHFKGQGFVVNVDCICHVVALAGKGFTSDVIVAEVVEKARSLAKELRKPNKVAQSQR
jgi:hypothetical protein